MCASNCVFSKKEAIDHKTAILLFTRTASEEAAAKQLVPGGGAAANLRLAKQLIEQAQRVARATGLPLICVSSRGQYGHSFGERLANALEVAFARGYERILAIGNDSPRLTAASLKLAAEKLNSGSMVIGPSTDQGAYLIGLSREQYAREAFIGLAWSTDRLYVSLKQYAYRYAGLPYVLPPLEDVDRPEDLIRLWRLLPFGHPLKPYLSILLSGMGASPMGVPAVAMPVARFGRCHQLRGPPCC